MASNYPPGVTGNEPQIAGEPPHYRQCPAHEDNVNAHDCGARWLARVEYDDDPPRYGHWILVIPNGHSSAIVPIYYCPYCGVELATKETAGPCECAEMREARREWALEDKEEKA